MTEPGIIVAIAISAVAFLLAAVSLINVLSRFKRVSDELDALPNRIREAQDKTSEEVKAVAAELEEKLRQMETRLNIQDGKVKEVTSLADNMQARFNDIVDRFENFRAYLEDVFQGEVKSVFRSFDQTVGNLLGEMKTEMLRGLERIQQLEMVVTGKTRAERKMLASEEQMDSFLSLESPRTIPEAPVLVESEEVSDTEIPVDGDTRVSEGPILEDEEAVAEPEEGKSEGFMDEASLEATEKGVSVEDEETHFETREQEEKEAEETAAEETDAEELSQETSETREERDEGEVPAESSRSEEGEEAGQPSETAEEVYEPSEEQQESQNDETPLEQTAAEKAGISFEEETTKTDESAQESKAEPPEEPVAEGPAESEKTKEGVGEEAQEKTEEPADSSDDLKRAIEEAMRAVSEIEKNKEEKEETQENGP